MLLDLSFYYRTFLLIYKRPNITKDEAIKKEKFKPSFSSSHPKKMVKTGLKKEKLATLDAG